MCFASNATFGSKYLGEEQNVVLLMVCRFRTDNLTSGPWQHSSFYFLSAETINQISLSVCWPLDTGHCLQSPDQNINNSPPSKLSRTECCSGWRKSSLVQKIKVLFSSANLIIIVKCLTLHQPDMFVKYLSS